MVDYPNGASVLIHNDPHANVVRVEAWHGVGSKDDPAGKAGLAHLTEHLATRASDAAGRRVSAMLAETTLGRNAFTGWERTRFVGEAAPAELALLMEAAGQRASGRCSLDEATFAREREVVRNEIRQRRANPTADLVRRLHRGVYGAGHPYTRDVGGDDAQIANLTKDDVCAFMRDHYSPSTTIVVVTGRIDPQDARRHADAYVGALAADPPRVEPVSIPLPPAGPREVTLDAPVDADAVGFAFQLPHRFDVNHFPVQALLNVLPDYLSDAALRSDRFADPLVLRLGDATAPTVALLATPTEPGTAGEDSARNALAGAFGEVTQAISNIPGVFSVCKQRVRKNVFRELATMETRGEMLVRYHGVRDTYGYIGTDLSLVDRMTQRSMLNALAVVFHPSRSVEVTVRADPKARLRATRRSARTFDPRTFEHPTASSAGALDAASRPMKLAPLPPEQFTAFALDNGLRVLLAQTTELPLMDVRLIVPVGNANVPANQRVLANLLPEVLRMSRTNDRSLPEKFVMAGGHLRGHTSAQATVFSVDGLSIYHDYLIAGLAAYTARGKVPEPSLWQMRKVMRQLETSKEFEALEVGFDAVCGPLYGPDHPACERMKIGADAYRGPGPKTFLKFKQRWYRAEGSYLVVTGAFDEKSVRAYIEREFTSATITDRWNGRSLRTKPPLDPPPNPSGERHLAILEGQGQTAVVILFAIPSITPDNHADLLVLTRQLSDAFGSMREDLGASYGFRAQLSESPPNIAIMGAVDSKRVSEVAKATLEILGRFKSGKLSAEAFVAARTGVVSKLRQEATDATLVADRIAFDADHGRMFNYHRTLVHKAAEVTLDTLRPLAQQVVDTDRAVFVLGGPKKAVYEGHTTLGNPSPRVLEGDKPE